MSSTDRNDLDGKIVLVRSTRDLRNPPTALRGTLRLAPLEKGRNLVQVVLDFPEMFTAPAHQKVIVLDDATVERLVSSVRAGTFECTLDYDFTQETEGQTAVAPRARGGKVGPDDRQSQRSKADNE